MSPLHFLSDFKVTWLLMIAVAYLLGSISPAIILGKLEGIDIRTKGSGNAGTTNVLRTLGKKSAIFTLIIDVLKGVIAVLLGTIIFGKTCGYICAPAVFLGHLWPCFYQFKGGKGVATAFGTVMAINWRVGLLALLVVIVVTLITKRMSAGSILGAVAFPILCIFFEPEFFVISLVMAFLVIYKHRTNIKRIMKGEEPPLGFLVKKGEK